MVRRGILGILVVVGDCSISGVGAGGTSFSECVVSVVAGTACKGNSSSELSTS